MEGAGPLGTPLGLAQGKRASPRGEAGTSGFLCVSDSDRRVPAELGLKKYKTEDFPGGLVVRSLSAHAGDTGSTPGQAGSYTLQGSLSPAPRLLKPAWPRAPAPR